MIKRIRIVDLTTTRVSYTSSSIFYIFLHHYHHRHQDYDHYYYYPVKTITPETGRWIHSKSRSSKIPQQLVSESLCMEINHKDRSTL